MFFLVGLGGAASAAGASLAGGAAFFLGGDAGLLVLPACVFFGEGGLAA